MAAFPASGVLSEGIVKVNETNQADVTSGNGQEQEQAPPVDAALAAAEAKALENRNSYLRAVAELDNYRKRAEREIDNARKFAIERFAQELVTVGDALEAGINAGSANPGPVLLEGAQATLRQLHKAFEKAGIKMIDPVGQTFDPEWHEAMVAQESPVEPNTVLNVIQKGYALNGRLLRPARVIVSKAPADGN
jgi:molecular chaperone GrpE